MKLIEIIKVLDQEIEWCNQNPMPEKVTPEFREGFIKGLGQAKYLLTKAHEVVKDYGENER